MKYPCNVICDLLPLYCDEVCSDESSEAVREHIAECESCRKMLEEMSQPQSVDTSEYDERQEKSIRSVRRKLKTKEIVLMIAAVIGVLAVRFIVVPIVVIAFATFGMIASGEASKIDTKDIEYYSDFFGDTIKSKYSDRHGLDDDIFPSALTDDMVVNDFGYAFSDMFSAEHIAYLDVTYTPSAYESELSRLNGKGIGTYIGVYSVTDEPSGYDLVALDANCSGFVYAMIPENGDCEIVYVMAASGSLCLDDDVLGQLPERYWLTDMDMADCNPYKDYCLEEAGKRDGIGDDDVIIMP